MTLSNIRLSQLYFVCALVFVYFQSPFTTHTGNPHFYHCHCHQENSRKCSYRVQRATNFRRLVSFLPTNFLLSTGRVSELCTPPSGKQLAAAAAAATNRNRWHVNQAAYTVVLYSMISNYNFRSSNATNSTQFNPIQSNPMQPNLVCVRSSPMEWNRILASKQALLLSL